MGEAHLHPTLEPLFAGLEAEGISWCLLRGATNLRTPSGDVDLLVRRSDRARLCRAAERLGFAKIPSWGHGSHTFFLTYYPPDDEWIKLDVVTELAFGPGFTLPTGVEPECLERRVSVEGVAVPAEADEFWMLLLHELLDKPGPVRRHAAARLSKLAPRAAEPGPLASFVDRLTPAGWSAELIAEEAACDNWGSLRELSPRLAANWRAQKRRDVRRRALAVRAGRAYDRWARLTTRRGLSVAFLGPDGVGKSTLAAGIQDSFYFPARSVYMGLYGKPRRAGRRRARGVGLTARLAMQWRRWLKADYLRRRGHLVLFDRYSYDALLPQRDAPSRRSRARRWLLVHTCPPPDLVFVLDAPGELAHSRKGEHDAAFLERQREGFRTLARRLPRALVVDASRSPDDVRREVTAAIWREYVRRWTPTTKTEAS